jgi:hypothetical protein
VDDRDVGKVGRCLSWMANSRPHRYIGEKTETLFQRLLNKQQRRVTEI